MKAKELLCNLVAAPGPASDSRESTWSVEFSFHGEDLLNPLRLR